MENSHIYDTYCVCVCVRARAKVQRSAPTLGGCRQQPLIQICQPGTCMFSLKWCDGFIANSVIVFYCKQYDSFHCKQYDGFYCKQYNGLYCKQYNGLYCKQYDSFYCKQYDGFIANTVV